MQYTVLDWLPTPGASVIEAALTYARHGLRVIPVHGIVDGRCTCKRDDCKPGKHPVPRAWQRRATCNVDEVSDMFREAPAASNVGLVMGDQGDGTYLIAFDIDGERGRERLAELETKHGMLPGTLASRSGRSDGGEHRIFMLGPGQDAKRIGNRVQLGLDLRAKGGQIVVCPSLHTSGSRYTWSNAVTFAALPDAWFEAIASPLPAPRTKPTGRVFSFGNAYVDKVIDTAVADIAAAGDGERNHKLWVKTCTVLEYCAGHNVSRDRALDRLGEAGRACGLPPREVDETLRKAAAHVDRTGATRHAPPPSARPTQGPSHAASNAEVVELDPVDPDAWRDDLATSRGGAVKPTFRNVCLILRHDPMFKGRLSYNRMMVVPFVDGRPMSDTDVARFREDIERAWRFPPTTEAIVNGVLLIGSENSFHPVQNYLNGLVWKGEKLIERVAVEVLGNDGSEITKRMLRAWFISAVARALRPGCKVDTTIVLRGDQGHKKSTFFAVLGGQWFTDTYVDVRSKDGLLQVHAAWLYEWGEIERITTRTSSSDVKAFLSSAKDDVRPPYGRGVVSQPRSSVIVGSTNKPFLDDETGSRRFWPIWVYKLVDIELLQQWRDQLWAEAVAAFKSGETWWLDEDDEKARDAASDDHMVENPWTEKIDAWVSSSMTPERRTQGVTIAEVIVGALNIDIGKIRGEETRVGKALRRLKWWPRQETRGSSRVRVYYPAELLLRHTTSAQPAQASNDIGCADQTSEIPGSTQPAQHAQPDTRGRSISGTGSDAGTRDHTCDQNASTRNAGANVNRGVQRVQVVHSSEIIEAPAQPRADVVQGDASDSGESGLSGWLRGQGIEPPPDENDD